MKIFFEAPLSSYNVALLGALFFILLLNRIQLSNASDDGKSMPKEHRHSRRHFRYGLPLSNAQSKESSEHFSLNCPHVADASNEEVKIEVTWTKDDTIWLKIENGERRIYNKLHSFDKKRIGNKSVLRVTLNKGRYVFGYDELTGDFVMEIRPVNETEDAGLWQCHVTVHQRGLTHSLTSRSRVKSRKTKISKGTTDDHEVPSPRWRSSQSGSLLTEHDELISSFTRPEQSTVEINRDSIEKRKVVVFDRQVAPEPDKSSTGRKMAIIEYEDANDYVVTGRHNMKRHRASTGIAASAPSTSTFTVFFAVLIII